MRTRSLTILTALLFAGCMGASEDPASTSGLENATVAPPGGALALPDVDGNFTVPEPLAWSKGDAWRIATSFGGGSESSVLVVTEAGTSHYTVSSTSEAMATYDAMEDISYVGPIRAADLSGAQEGTPVTFFSFPLEDGKTWTTTWDGLQVTLQATVNAGIDTPLGRHPGFDIVGRTDGDVYVTYDYVPALKWWSRIAWAEGYGFKVEGFQANWTGAVKSVHVQRLLELATDLPVGTTPGGEFTVPADHTHVLMTGMGYGNQRLRALVLLDPDGPVLTDTSNVEAQPSVSTYSFQEQFPAKPGAWHVVAPHFHDPNGYARITFDAVAVEDVPVV